MVRNSDGVNTALNSLSEDLYELLEANRLPGEHSRERHTAESIYRPTATGHDLPTRSMNTDPRVDTGKQGLKSEKPKERGGKIKPRNPPKKVVQKEQTKSQDVKKPTPGNSSVETKSLTANSKTVGPLTPERMIHVGGACLAGRDFVWISIDLEWFERMPRKITEIGISILDSRPAEAFFMPKIHTVHMVPSETAHLRNGKFVADNMNNFGHGTTIRMPLSQCRATLELLFERYAPTTRKNVFIVGHGVKTDLTMLRKQDFNIPEEIPILDTEMIAAYDFPHEVTSLWVCLRRLHVGAGLLHNAGNDARATLELLINQCDPVARKKFGLDRIKHEEVETRTIWRPPSKTHLPKEQRKSISVKQHSAGYFEMSDPESVVNGFFSI